MSFVEIMAANPWLLFLSVFITGLMVGSFLNVVIFRFPELLKYEWEKECAEYFEKPFEKEKPPGLAVSRSHCPKCKNQLKAWHNIPVISYLLLKGRCAFCHSSVSLRYPFVELFTALCSLLMAVHFGFGWQLLASLLLLWVLVVITFIDLDTYLIPDQLSLTLLWMGLFCALFELFIPLQQSVIGVLIGYLSLWSVFWLFKLATRKEGMGYGDFKLLAAGGAWLGAEVLLVVLIVASVSGLFAAVLSKIFANGGNKIPFGPYLSLGILVSFLWGQELLAWYLP